MQNLMISAGVLGLSALFGNVAIAQKPATNVLLVHGAWVDGSGWRPVYERLSKDGFNVTIVQLPLTSFADDTNAVRRALALQDGPTVLVGHSYGGAVITEAGSDPHVTSLVYVAAHMPDAGESEAADGKRYPSDLSQSGFIRTTSDHFNYLDTSAFRAYFAADLPASQADFEAHSQVPTAIASFGAIISVPAWRSRQSWMIVAGSDRTINPELERWYAKRAGSHVTELSGASHSVYESRPNEVADVIEEAAKAAKK